MILSAIAAMAANRAIGKENGLPWSIPEDFKFFKDKTMGHIMIMGRKTFDSLGGPLPGRMHIVITRQKDLKLDGASVVSSPNEAVDMARQNLDKYGNEVFIIGGAEIYNLMMPLTDRIYLTEISVPFAGDAYFPEFNKDQFRETERKARPGPPAFDFVTYDRR
jgi:dihydrofolate reductase